MQNKSFSKNILRGINNRIGKLFHNPFRAVNVGPFRKIYYKHLSAGKIRTHQLFGKNLSYYSPTELLHGLQEIFVDEIYKQKLPPKPLIIDCGANIGLSVIYMKQLYPDAEIIAFEPDEMNFRLLEKNIQSFDYKNVEARKEAVWTQNTILSFAGEGSMSSRIDTESSRNSVDVKAIRLKDLLNRKVHFLKIDIEGAEFEVIKDIEDHLHFVDHLFLEYHGSFRQNAELVKMFDILMNKGFTFYIKEATSVYDRPFIRERKENMIYDVQLNIFCERSGK